MASVIIYTNAGYKVDLDGKTYDLRGGSMINIIDDHILRELLKKYPFLAKMEDNNECTLSFGNSKPAATSDKEPVAKPVKVGKAKK